MGRPLIEEVGVGAASVAWWPGREEILVANGREGVRVLSARTGGEQRRLATGPAKVLAVSQDGSTLALRRWSGALEVWDLEAEKRRVLLEAPRESPWIFPRISLSPDGERLRAVWGTGSTIATWSLAGGPSPRLLAVGGRRPLDAFSPCGNLVAVCSLDGGLDLVEVESGEVHLTLEEGRPGAHPIQTASFSPDGRRFAWTGGDGALRLYHLRRRTEEATLPLPGRALERLEFSPDGTRLAFGTSRRRLRTEAREPIHEPVGLFDLERSRLVFRHAGFRLPVRGLAFSPGGERLAACTGRLALVWDCGDGQLLADAPLGP